MLCESRFIQQREENNPTAADDPLDHDEAGAFDVIRNEFRLRLSVDAMSDYAEIDSAAETEGALTDEPIIQAIQTPLNANDDDDVEPMSITAGTDEAAPPTRSDTLKAIERLREYCAVAGIAKTDILDIECSIAQSSRCNAMQTKVTDNISA